MAFAGETVRLIAAGLFSLQAIIGLLVLFLQVSFLIFLAAFISNVAIITPMFLAFERSKFRKAWPYFAAAIAIASVVLGLLKSRIDFFMALTWRDIAVVIAPALIIAAVFVRRMRPFWRAAEAHALAPQPGLRRFH